jgi:hypothetical protein
MRDASTRGVARRHYIFAAVCRSWVGTYVPSTGTGTAVLGPKVGRVVGWSSHAKRHPLSIVATNACSDRYFSLTQSCY